MSQGMIMWGGLAVMTLVVLVLMGPFLWSNRDDYPLLQIPWKWIKSQWRKLRPER